MVVVQSTGVSQMNKYIYILTYSCAHTLANKDNSSVSKVFKKSGNFITAVQIRKDRKSNKELESSITLLNYLACKKTLEKGPRTSRMEDDFLHFINWRTVYKMYKYCVMCWSYEKVQMHHIKHVRKLGETTDGLKKVMAILNRKQMCVCSAYHKRIQSGKYSGINLADFYDPDLASE
jgi:hypothetical protein